MTTVVVSAVNFSEGGPLTVLRQCLESARLALGPNDRLIALVHDCALVEIEGVEAIAFPKAKRSYLRRLQLEYFGFKKLSSKLKPDLWLSLHDMSPRLNGEAQAVYCHNPAPFFSPTWRDIWFEPSLGLFSAFYRWIYRFNLHSNRLVIVQQDWLRKAFRDRYGAKNIIVAYPRIDKRLAPLNRLEQFARMNHEGPLVLFYPTLPRAFKNIETLCAAIELVEKRTRRPVKLHVTIDGSENSYARSIVKRYGQCEQIAFIGRQDRSGMAREYASCSALAFPSRLETWGLPITEAKDFAKPLMVADLPYAREAVGSYNQVAFIAATDVDAWADAMLAASNDHILFKSVEHLQPAQPFASDWAALWHNLSQLLRPQAK
jgi:glycosyltransferase involved in cell wall biosynthesis